MELMVPVGIEYATVKVKNTSRLSAIYQALDDIIGVKVLKKEIPQNWKSSKTPRFEPAPSP